MQRRIFVILSREEITTELIRDIWKDISSDRVWQNAKAVGQRRMKREAEMEVKRSKLIMGELVRMFY